MEPGAIPVKSTTVEPGAGRLASTHRVPGSLRLRGGTPGPLLGASVERQVCPAGQLDGGYDSLLQQPSVYTGNRGNNRGVAFTSASLVGVSTRQTLTTLSGFGTVRTLTRLGSQPME